MVTVELMTILLDEFIIFSDAGLVTDINVLAENCTNITQTSNFLKLTFTLSLERIMSSLALMLSNVASVGQRLHCQDGKAGIAELFNFHYKEILF